MKYDLLLGDFQQSDKPRYQGVTYVWRLDFVYWSIPKQHCNEIVSQWEISDGHYDLVVCEGKPEELLVFAKEWDMLKFEYFTFSHPLSAYRLAAPGEMDAYAKPPKPPKSPEDCPNSTDTNNADNDDDDGEEEPPPRIEYY